MTEFSLVVAALVLIAILTMTVFAWKALAELRQQLESVAEADPAGLVSRVELELQGLWSRHWLRRCFLLAPLIGLFLTAVGFLWLDGPKLMDSDDPLSFFKTLKPLYFGITCGAFLAISAQLCLGIIEQKIADLRKLAGKLEVRPTRISHLDDPLQQVGNILRSMCDTASVRLQQILDDGYRNMGDFVKVSRGAASVLKAATDDLERVRGTLDDASRGLGEATTHFATQVSSSAQVLEKQAGSLSAALEEGADDFADAGAVVRESIGEFRQSSKMLGEVVGGFAKRVDSLESDASRYAEVARKSLESVGVFEQRLATELAPALKATVGALQTSSEGFQRVSTVTSQAGTKLETTSSQWVTSAGQLHQATQELGRMLPGALDQFRQLPETLGRYERLLGDALENMNRLIEGARKGLEDSAREQSKFNREAFLADGQEVFRKVAAEVEQLTRVGQQTAGTIRDASTSINGALTRNVENLALSSRDLQSGVQGMSRTLDANTTRLSTEIAGLLRLVESMSGSTETLIRSNEQVRAALESLVSRLSTSDEGQVRNSSYFWPFSRGGSQGR